MKLSHVKSSAAAALFLLFLVPQAVPCSASVDPLAEKTGYFFDTVITVSLYDTADESVLDACFDRMEYYESIFSRTVEGSDVWNINNSHGEPVEVSDDTISILNEALRYCELSDGALDITIAPAVSLWDFHEDSEKIIPDQSQLDEALKHIDYKNVIIDGNTVTLKDPEAAIDLGCIAKGYISDRVKETLLENGCESALINLGGNVLAVGNKPDGTDFKIGIRRPFGENAYDISAVVPVNDVSVITSGTYERYFEVDGVIYHHILDPKTGSSVRNELTSVSIMSPRGTDGDALSTTCFILGSEKGMELIESLDGIEALFIDDQENLIFSSGWPQ